MFIKNRYLILALSIISITSFTQANALNNHDIIKSEYQAVNKAINSLKTLNYFTDYKKKKFKQKLNYLSNKWSYYCGFLPVSTDHCPVLHKTVSDLCNKMNICTPRISIFEGNWFYDYLADTQGMDLACNAFATSHQCPQGDICIGKDLIEHLNYEELTAVIAHELGHLKLKHTTKQLVATEVIAGVGGTSIYLLSPFVFSSYPALVPYAALVGTSMFFPLQLFLAGLSRKHERQADAVSYEITGDPDSLYIGLDKIGKTYRKKRPGFARQSAFIMKLFPFLRSHPTNDERKQNIQKLHEQRLLRENTKLSFGPEKALA